MTIPNTRYITYFIVSLFFSVITNSNVLAQNANKFNISMNAGPALALGQLASQQYNSGGYALSGFSTLAAGIWYFRPALGVGVAISATSFPFADGAYGDEEPAFPIPVIRQQLEVAIARVAARSHKHAHGDLVAGRTCRELGGDEGAGADAVELIF